MATKATSGAQYLPFNNGSRHYVIQGPGGSYSHNWSTTKDAWDFSVAWAEDIRAAFTGRIYAARGGCAPSGSRGCGSGWGNYVLQQNADGSCAIYAHLSSIRVGAGQTVGRYTVIGGAGNSGNSTGTHLHFGRVACSSQLSIPSAFADVGFPRQGQWVTSGNGPEDLSPQFDDVRVYSSPTVEVAAGDTVRMVMTARYLGPQPIPCGLANAGTRNDQAARFAAMEPGPWPQSPWRWPSRVAAVGCIGDLDPGERGEWWFTFHPPLDTPGGDYLVGVMGIVHEGRAWSNVSVPFTLRVKSAVRAEFAGQEVSEFTVPGESGHLMVALKNTGRIPWRRGEVNLGVLNDQRFEFANGDWGDAGSRVFLREDEVPVGEVGHFEASFDVPANTVPGCRRVRFAPVREHIEWFAKELGIFLDVCVGRRPFPAPPGDAPAWKAIFVSQSGPALIEPGGEGHYAFVVENRGRQTWTSQVRLATPDDQPVRFAGDGVIGNSNRVAFTDEDGDGYVQYGEKARFEYSIRPPANAAAYFKQYWHLVDEGNLHFFQEAGMHLPVLVASATNWPAELRPELCQDWQLVSQDPPVTVSDGQPATFTWVIRNTGACPWFASGRYPFRLGTDNPRDGSSPFYTVDDPAWLSSSRIRMQEEVVPPGGTATFRFTVTKPSGMAPTADARLYATPVFEAWSWARSIGMFARIKVR